ncbi:MAG: hypothetical protein IJX81_04695 [Clostridia bacterium]|nr:hypothetical protein [Clostridia bacterium]
MDAVNVITLVISGISAASVFIMSFVEAQRSRREKLENKQTSWYQSEVLSPTKTNDHFNDLKAILQDGNSSKQEKCERLNEAMLDFFYNSINYIAFFNVNDCNGLKQKIMVAIDDVMYSVLVADEKLPPREGEKILTVYRMRIMHLFYEFDMKNR